MENHTIGVCICKEYENGLAQTNICHHKSLSLTEGQFGTMESNVYLKMTMAVFFNNKVLFSG
jgi:hypothetical protein